MNTSIIDTKPSTVNGNNFDRIYIQHLIFEVVTLNGFYKRELVDL